MVLNSLKFHVAGNCVKNDKKILESTSKIYKKYVGIMLPQNLCFLI
jgi:hypothetical protein